MVLWVKLPLIVKIVDTNNIDIIIGWCYYLLE